ncbi:MAG: protein phosphatase 2C domain-containing protein [Verrucomicrobiota bacterium]
MKEVKDSIRSHVRIGFDGSVHKTFRGTDADKRFAREVEVLQYLEKLECDYVPRVLEHDPKTLYLVTTNCGQVADKVSERKQKELFGGLLDDYGVKHGDEFPRNITYDARRGHFCVIDFELAEIVDEKAPGHHPKAAPEVTWAAQSLSGKRKEDNDDSVLVFSCEEGEPEGHGLNDTFLLEDQSLVFVISDGMGGCDAGDIASRTVADELAEFLPRTQTKNLPSPPDHYYLSCLAEVIGNVHSKLNAAAVHETTPANLAATLTLCWLSQHKIHVAHVGDGRLYRCRDAQVSQLTKDHTFAWSAYNRGEINEYHFRTHPRRNVVYRILGGGHQSVTPQLFSDTFHRGDRYVLMTDGVVDGLKDAKIQQAFQDTEDPASLLDLLVQPAFDLAGEDDTSAIVFDVV